jgi:drug/metabolite transporter (DMT)-like permease
VDSFSFGKLIAVGLSLGGVAMVALTDSNSSDGDSLAGDILCLIGAPSPNPPITATTVMGPPSSLRRALPPSNVITPSVNLAGAAFYALYVVLLKLLIKDETKLNTRRFFGTPPPPASPLTAGA